MCIFFHSIRWSLIGSGQRSVISLGGRDGRFDGLLLDFKADHCEWVVPNQYQKLWYASWAYFRTTLKR